MALTLTVDERTELERRTRGRKLRTDGTVIGSDGNISLSPVFANAPLFWDHTNATGTSTTAIVFDSTRYAVNDWIEYKTDYNRLPGFQTVRASLDQFSPVGQTKLLC